MKRIFTLIALLLAMAVPAFSQGIVPSLGSHNERNEACDAGFPNGFRNTTGSGANGAFVLKYFVYANYQIADFPDLLHSIVDNTTNALNIFSRDRGYSVRFQGEGWNDTTYVHNFTIYVNMYKQNDGTYTAVLDVHGWSRGHLFTIVESNSDPGAAYAAAAERLPRFINNGWTCGN